MKTRKAGNAGQFKKGDDPRRHMDGSKSKEAVAFSKTLRALLVEEGEAITRAVDKDGNIVEKRKVEFLVKSVWKKAIEGESWAVIFIAERVEGKVSQNIDIDGNMDLTYIISDKFLPNKDEEENTGDNDGL